MSRNEELLKNKMTRITNTMKKDTGEIEEAITRSLRGIKFKTSQIKYNDCELNTAKTCSGWF